MSDFTRAPEPSWLQAAVDQRIAFITEQGAIEMGKEAGAIIAVFLTEPGEGVEPNSAAWERWEHSCDNCGVYARNRLKGGHVEREQQGVKIAVTFGCCERCAAA